MSGDLSTAHYEMVTNDFVNDLKSLSLSQSTTVYSNTIDGLLVQVKQATPDGLLLKNKPFTLAIVNNFYRLIPIFEQKLSDRNENFCQTNLFLQTFADLLKDVCLLDLLLAIKDPTRLEIIFYNYIPLLKQEYFTDDNQYDQLVNCLLPIIIYSGVLISINENNLPSNLLSYLLEFMKNNWRDERRERIVHNILAFIKILSKKPLIIPLIIRCEWPDACIQWLKTPGPRPSYTIDYYICLVLQKLARHSLGVEVLNQLNCIEAFDESKELMKEAHKEEDYLSIYFLQCITYVLLVEADIIKQNSMLADRLVCDVLEQLISYTIQATENTSFIYKCHHITDLLCVLCKLFVNDDVLRKCLKDNSQLFDCLCQLLIQFSVIDPDTPRIQQVLNDEALVSSANLLWSISFHECYHDKFRSNKNLMHTLSNLATSSSLYTNMPDKSIPRDVCSLKKATEGILWNLKSLQLIQQKEPSDQKPFIMISYSHSDSTFCHTLVNHLSQHVPLWVDYQHVQHNTIHSDDLWEEIAGAMEMATVIIVMLSKEYYNSKSCRQELSYATDTLKKRIVPIYTPDQQYKANGWLGIRIAGQKYVHFGRKVFTNALDELVSLITAEQKPTSLPKPALAKTHGLKNWTSKDIQQWFTDHHIHKDLITLFADHFHTGTALILYACHLKQFYRNEYREILINYQKLFPGQRLQTIDFITFVDALWRLCEEYDPQNKMEDAWNHLGGNLATKNSNDGLTWL